jgi:hypothetical protein
MATKLLCSGLCLFDAIDDLQAMDKKLFNDFCIGKKNEYYM